MTKAHERLVRSQQGGWVLASSWVYPPERFARRRDWRHLVGAALALLGGVVVVLLIRGHA